MKFEQQLNEKPALALTALALKLVGVAVLFVAVVSLGHWVLSGNSPTAYLLARVFQQKPNLIDNTEWFKREYEAIQALSLKIQLAQASLASIKQLEKTSQQPNSAFQKDDISGIEQSIQAAQQKLADMVDRYNIRAQLADSNVRFSQNLPKHVTIPSRSK